MANIISQRTIDTIKENVPIESVIDWLGVRYLPNRKMAWCPFCADKNSRNPGLSYKPSEGYWHCFVCGRGGDCISFVREYDNSTFVEAVEKLAKRFNIPIQYDETISATDNSVFRKYTSCLGDAKEIFIKQRQSAKFREFVESRSLSEEAIDEFEIGMSDRKWEHAAISRLSEKYDKDTLIGCGLCSENNGQLHLKFIDRVMFPIKRVSGETIGFGGRAIDATSKAKYINTKETEIFKKSNILYGFHKAKQHIKRAQSVIICEGYMDTVALYTHGFKNSVGAMGTALTRENLISLSNLASTAYISLDSDKAGVSAAMRTIDNVPPSFPMAIKVVSIPNSIAKDPDEFFKVEDDDRQKMFSDLLLRAEPLSMFCAKSIISEEAVVISDSLDAIRVNPDDVNDMNATISNARDVGLSKLSTFMGAHIASIGEDEAIEIAERCIDILKSSETPQSLVKKWKSAAASSKHPKRAGNANPKESLSGSPRAYQYRANADEDSLIKFCYENGVSMLGAKASLDDIKGYISNKERLGIFSRICDLAEQGKTTEHLDSMLTNAEKEELARILTSLDIPASQDIDIASILSASKRKKLEEDIKQITESPLPDFSKLIQLRQELSSLG